MRRRFNRRAGSGRRRSVAWIPGFTSFDNAAGTSNRLLSFAAVPLVTNIWSVAVQLTVDADLSLHGGEDAVLERIRGDLFFMEGRRNAGAGFAAAGFQLRCVIAQVEVETDPAAVTFNHSFITSNDLGQDRILWAGHTMVSSVAVGAAGAGFDAVGPTAPRWLDVDVRAKRKLQSDNVIAAFFQTVFPAGTTAADMRMFGGLRMLLKRPR